MVRALISGQAEVGIILGEECEVRRLGAEPYKCEHSEVVHVLSGSSDVQEIDINSSGQLDRLVERYAAVTKARLLVSFLFSPSDHDETRSILSTLKLLVSENRIKTVLEAEFREVQLTDAQVELAMGYEQMEGSLRSLFRAMRSPSSDDSMAVMSAQHERGGLGLAKFGTARAVRAGGGPFVDLSLIQKAQEASDKGGKSDPIRTWSRRSMILPEFVGLTFNVYNGKSFVPIRILGSMIGRKLGDFAPITTGLSTENAKRKMGD